MKLEVLIEVWQSQKSLQSALAHLLKIFEFHVICDQGDDVFGVVAGELQSVKDVTGDFDTNLGVSIEANAIGNSKGRGLADVVEQDTHGQVRAGMIQHV